MASTLLSWSNLPEDILPIIANRLLQFPDDLSRFRSVCSSWRASTPPFKISLPFPDFLIDNSGEHTPLNQVILYCIEPLINEPLAPSPTSWVIAVQYLKNKLYYVDPLTSLPTGFRPEMPKVFNPCDFRITELKKFYGTTEVEKMVIVSTQHYDCTMLALLPCLRYLAFYGLVNNQWVMVKEIDDMIFTDIELYQGKVWGVVRDGRTVVFTSALDAIETTPGLLPDEGRTARFQFIESCGDFFVTEYDEFCRDEVSTYSGMFEEMIPMKIHKLIAQENMWVQVRHLDDRLFVLAQDFPWSFSVPSRFSPGGLKNYIVCSSRTTSPSEICEIYDESIVPLCWSYSLWDIETDKHEIVPYAAAGSELFWRPPCWLIGGNPCGVKKIHRLLNYIKYFLGFL